jgi:hypothetical protein
MVSIEHDALKRFVEATQAFEAGFGQALFGMLGPRSEYGETYVQYLNGYAPSDRIEGELFPCPDDATTATFSRLAARHPPDKSLTLYWRIKPEISYFADRNKGSLESGYHTYCRFLVSDKRPINHG